MNERSDGSSFLDRMAIVTAGRRYPLSSRPLQPEGVDPASYRPASLAAEARRWSYVLRSRERWRDSADALAMHQRDAMATLNAFGLDEAAVREMAVAGHLVVEMPYEVENVGWDGRTFPWEFVLSRATRPFRRGGPQLTVMRHLAVDAGRRKGRARWPPEFAPQAFSGRRLAPRVLFVQSFPGALAQTYDAQQEQERMRAAFDMAADDARWRVLDTPTLDELRKTCEGFKPEIVHFTGCDSHQGLVLLRECGGEDARITMGTAEWTVAELLGQAETVFDGCLLRREDGLATMVRPQQLASALVAGRNAPFFVGLNVWNSAARLAPMLLPAGVLASMGFQDSFDDSLSEYFFENLYGRLRLLDWCLPIAFDSAWAEVRRQVDLVPGTGIALWARAPLTPPRGRESAPRAVGVEWRSTAPPGDKATLAPATVSDGRPSAPSSRSSRPSPVELLVTPKTEINYAELHNHRPLFDRFELRCTVPDAVPRLHIVVELHVGPERARYECEIELSAPRVNLLKRIQVPLTAALMRTVSEAVLSTLFVQITVDGLAVLTDTYPLRLLPVDQWRDNLSSGKWLPSFVLPRDPAIQRAVSAAQRYVRVIRDDPSAGFEGYQSAPSPDEDALDNIDLQVEAIWAALLHEWQLGYINPPPAYSAHLDSQRLRTPSAIHDSRMGTCIDLAAMFAACLELVDIYPVIFLLKGHALPGYWRHSSFQSAFRAALPAGRDDDADTERDAADTGKVQRAPWWTIDHASVWKLIREGRLAPIETVRLTEHCGFREARQAGIDALREAADFDSILDIATAREHLITPLPIIGDRP
ncbi:hypothetical protein [Aquabacterium sp.]|uniref:hypothetical protein n=1 Tax=Aquabacterium sp. TaxID=1872578 RepID=UPI002BCBDDD6|nr:hypothetical protein [Aquabacterium sp.]HSW06716.1 hypothetical protein [Aquabacterium sp.]